ncbi:restriction endonuclease subunit S [Micromonospora haikouensis]|uniref:restriction endonuclease subunit S n=1 Tax=Micromonospora haikouensis TaxID=686309 RepID=UPI0037B52612
MTLTMRVQEIVAEVESGSRGSLLSKHNSWRRVRLGDVADVQNGAAFSSRYFNSDGKGLPLIRIRDVGKSEAKTYYSGEYELRYLVDPGDVLVGMDGDFRVAAWGGPQGLLNQRVCRITVRDSDCYDRRFLLFVLQGYLDAIWEKTSSVTVKHLSSRTVEDIPLPLPPIAEQLRIVAALEGGVSRLEAGVSQLHIARIRLASWEASFAAALITGRQAGKGGGFGLDGWREVCVGDLALVGTGATPLRSRKEYYTGGTVPWVTSGLLNQPFVDEATELITELALAETSAKLWPVGTLLVAMYGEGRTRGMCSELRISAATNQACAAVKLKPEWESYRPWVKLFFHASYERNRRLASGGVQPNLSLGVIRDLRVPIPPEDERDRLLGEFVSQQESGTRLRRVLDDTMQKSKQLRRRLLAEAFAGRLVPQDPDDEPASELLARIRAERAATIPKQRTRSRRTAKELPAPATRVTGDDYQQETLPL